MNELTKTLTTAESSVALDIAHEQTVLALQALYDLAKDMDKHGGEAQIIAKQIVIIAEQISLGCRNIFISSNSCIKETSDLANKIVNGWQQIATSTIGSLNNYVDKNNSEKIN